MKEKKGLNLHKLKGLLAENDMTYAIFAKKVLNISLLAAHNKLSGKAPFKDYEIRKILNYFNKQADFLFTL